LGLADLDLDASASPRDGDVGVRLLPRLLVGLDLAGYQFLGHHALRSAPSRGVSGTPRVPGIHRVPLIGSAILGRAQILDQTALVRGQVGDDVHAVGGHGRGLRRRAETQHALEQPVDGGDRHDARQDRRDDGARGHDAREHEAQVLRQRVAGLLHDDLHDLGDDDQRGRQAREPDLEEGARRGADGVHLLGGGHGQPSALSVMVRSASALSTLLLTAAVIAWASAPMFAAIASTVAVRATMRASDRSTLVRSWRTMVSISPVSLWTSESCFAWVASISGSSWVGVVAALPRIA